MARRSVLLALVVAVAAFGGACGQGCPFSAADVQRLDFSQAARSCRTGIPLAQLCESCVCALVDAFAPAAAAAGITPDQVTGVSQDQATQLLNACAGTVLGPLRSAGVPIQALFQLQSCQGSGVTPSCLAGLAQQAQTQAQQAQPVAQPEAQPEAQPVAAQPAAEPVARPAVVRSNVTDVVEALGALSRARARSQQAQATVAAAQARARRN